MTHRDVFKEKSILTNINFIEPNVNEVFYLTRHFKFPHIILSVKINDCDVFCDYCFEDNSKNLLSELEQVINQSLYFPTNTHLSPMFQNESILLLERQLNLRYLSEGGNPHCLSPLYLTRVCRALTKKHSSFHEVFNCINKIGAVRLYENFASKDLIDETKLLNYLIESS